MPLKTYAIYRAAGKAQQLIRISTPVSAELEITEITDRVSKLPGQQNQALLFERVQGRASPERAGADQRVWLCLSAWPGHWA
jgi:UbiD family decarboxylase